MELAVFKHHWVQASTQMVIYAYLAWYLPGVRFLWPMLLAQLFFAYGFHILLTWSRRDYYGLGFGPVPITASFNLFILFKPQWFYWQFGIVAIAFLAKELIRWQRDGRSTHIFNPSSLSLVLFSAALLLMGATDTTLGVEISSWLAFAPHMHVMLFLVSIPVQLLFGVATMTFSAFATVYLCGLAFFGVTGTYFFFDSYIPVAVFIGMLLLVTDPATSPRTESGRVLFGMLYGLGIMVTFGLLQRAGLPTFYDKLLPVPLVNLLVRGIDHFVEEGRLPVFDVLGLGQMLSGARRRSAIVGLWACTFIAIAAVGGIGDEHRGQWVPFWQQTCEEGSDRACDHLAVLEQNLCLADSGWACNELGILLTSLGFPDSEIEPVLARGCGLGFSPACQNLTRFTTGAGSLRSASPLPHDLPILLRGSKGPIRERDPVTLFARACELGFSGTCETT